MQYMIEEQEHLGRFALNDNIIQSANLQNREPDYTFTKHSHHNIELYLILHGSCKMTLGKEQRIFLKDALIIVLPHTVHSFETIGNETCSFLHIHFNPSKLSQFDLKGEHFEIDLLSFLNPIRNFCYVHANQTIKELYHNIIAEANRANLFSHMYCY